MVYFFNTQPPLTYEKKQNNLANISRDPLRIDRLLHFSGTKTKGRAKSGQNCHKQSGSRTFTLQQRRSSCHLQGFARKSWLRKKTKLGDNLTPEGRFKGKKKPQTQYHKAIEVGEWGTCCDVLIHGLGNEYGPYKRFQRWYDWTEGCIALTNDEIDEIYKAVDNGVVIEINP